MRESILRLRAMEIFDSLRPDHHVYKWLVLVTVMMGTFMVILDGTIVNVAIPSIMASYGVTISEVVWVSTAYLVALSILLAVSGWISDHVGARRAYMLGLLIFIGSSYLCGIAKDLHFLIAFRVIQGIGGGILTPVGMILFTTEFPPEKRIVPLGFYSISIAAAISLGPTVGGYLIQKMDWSWIFFINVPIGIFTMAAAWVILKTTKGKKFEKFDFWGFLWLTVFLVFLIVAISSGNAPWNAEGWTSKYTIAYFFVSIFGAFAFVWTELHTSHPVVNIHVFRDRNFFLGNLVLFIFSFTLFGSSFLLPLYLQNGLGYSKISTGLALLPLGLAQGVFGAVSGLLIRWVPARLLVIIGIVGLGITYYFNADFTLYTSKSEILWLFAWRGVAMALMFAPLVAITLSTIPEEKMSQATGLFTVQRQIGAAMGVAVFETIFTLRATYHSAMYGLSVDPTSPAFEEVVLRLQGSAFTDSGSSALTAAMQAQQIIIQSIENHVFIQAIADNLLIAGFITFLSCIPLFFLKKSKTSLMKAFED